MRTMCVVGVAALSLPSVVFGQSFNIDCGESLGVPASSYAAVGRAGVWNSFGPEIAPPGGVATFPLMALDGSPTSATIRQIGANSVQFSDDPATSGDDHALLDDYAQATNSPLDGCFFFAGLENGTYEVIFYGWTPNEPTRLSRLRVDPPATGGPIMVGGTWTGEHASTVTYARDRLTITNGQIGMHSGLFGGNVLSTMNGVQLVKLPPVACAGDVDGSGAVNFDDLNVILENWGEPGGRTFAQGDIDGDGSVTFDDLNTLLETWGSVCP